MCKGILNKCSFVAICCVIVTFIGFQVTFASEKLPGQAEGQKHFENNDIAKSIASFKSALAKAYPELGGKAKDDKKTLLKDIDDEHKAALANYQLGLIYEAEGDLDAAASKFSNALTIRSHGGAKYIGSKKCKMCHLKQYKSWEATRMAKTFEVLKPGVKAEAKTKLNFDPKKDYTKDTKCLPCHTTGYGLPGGYKIPNESDPDSVAQAKINEGCLASSVFSLGVNYNCFSFSSSLHS